MIKNHNNFKTDNIEKILFDYLNNNGSALTKKQFNIIIKKYNLKFNYKKIHIVGTNGKGSVAKFLNDNLINENLNVGCFTSPHLVSLYERITINNQQITFEDLTSILFTIITDFPYFEFNFFSLMFLICLIYFDQHSIDVAIFEAGIGAKKDIVNFLNHDITVICSISVDHQQILGKTIRQIALDKSKCIKNNKQRIYMNINNDNKVVDIFQKQTQKFNNKIFFSKKNKTNYVNENISLAKLVLSKEFGIKTNLIFNLPKGRMSIFNINGFDCILDVSHNYDGIYKTLLYLKKEKKKYDQIVFSLSNDKDVVEISNLLLRQNKEIFCFQNSSIKALNISKYPKQIKRIFNLKLFISNLNKSTLFIGSFYLINDLIKIIY